MLTLRRARRPLAIVCLAVVALAVFVPGATVFDVVAPAPEYVLLPQLAPLDVVSVTSVPVEQPAALRAAVPERAPPVPV